ncbi:MAG: alpha/beta hydrolase fold domain-containing protein [Christensenellales bacterium]|jgi:acetyl esterase/lipase
MIKVVLLIILLLALRAWKPARAAHASHMDAAMYARPERWVYSLEELPRVRFDIPYAGEHSTHEQILHIAYPDAGEGPFPLAIFIHGGGWSRNNSSGHQILYTGNACLDARARGYAVAFVDYRLDLPQVMPHQLYDVKSAIRFLKANAAQYALRADEFVLIGDSAGAHLANLAALTADQAEFEEPNRAHPQLSCDVRAVVSWHAINDFSSDMSELLGWFYGLDSAQLTVEDIERLSRRCSPVHNVRPGNAPPFYLQHGLIDSETPYTQSCDLYNALVMKAPHPLHKLELFPGMEHAVMWFFSHENMKNILDWMDRVLGR